MSIVKASLVLALGMIAGGCSVEETLGKSRSGGDRQASEGELAIADLFFLETDLPYGKGLNLLARPIQNLTVVLEYPDGNLLTILENGQSPTTPITKEQRDNALIAASNGQAKATATGEVMLPTDANPPIFVGFYVESNHATVTRRLDPIQGVLVRLTLADSVKAAIAGSDRFKFGRPSMSNVIEVSDSTETCAVKFRLETGLIEGDDLYLVTEEIGGTTCTATRATYSASVEGRSLAVDTASGRLSNPDSGESIRNLNGGENFTMRICVASLGYDGFTVPPYGDLCKNVMIDPSNDEVDIHTDVR